MTALEKLKASDAWDTRYDLPLFPKYNNPWIYGAVALKLLRKAGLSATEDAMLVTRFEAHAEACRAKDIEGNPIPGLFSRWPNGAGGHFSHDEIIGLAYISAKFAREILDYLEENDGVYSNIIGAISDPSFADRYNVYRILYVKPFLQACTQRRRVGFASQLQWSSTIITDAIHYKRGDTGDAGGRMRTWLMLDHMGKHFISGTAGLIWKAAMRSKGATLQGTLSLEPGSGYPIMREITLAEFDF